MFSTGVSPCRYLAGCQELGKWRAWSRDAEPETQWHVPDRLQSIAQNGILVPQLEDILPIPRPLL